MTLLKYTLCCLPLCFLACNYQQEVVVAEQQEQALPSPAQIETELNYPIYELEYDINMPRISPRPAHNHALMFIDWSRCEQCPCLINYGKDVKIQ